MPVRKYRTVEEMPPPPRGDIRDPAFRDAVRGLLAMTASLAPVAFPPGVHKYRSVEEMNAARARWERAARPRR